MSGVRTVGVGIAGALLVLGGVMVWKNLTTPVNVLGYGEVTADSRFGNGQAITVRTRRVRIGEIVSQQVELGPETWADCGGDCAETLRKQDIDFWETRRRREH